MMKKSIRPLKYFFPFKFLMGFAFALLVFLVLESQSVRASSPSSSPVSFSEGPVLGLEHLQQEVHVFLNSFHKKDALLELEEALLSLSLKVFQRGERDKDGDKDKYRDKDKDRSELMGLEKKAFEMLHSLKTSHLKKENEEIFNALEQAMEKTFHDLKTHGSQEVIQEDLALLYQAFSALKENDLILLERMLQSGNPDLWSNSLAQRLNKEEPLEFNAFLFYLLDIYRYQPQHRPALEKLFNDLHGESILARWEERSRRSYQGGVLEVLDGALLGALLLMTVRSGRALSKAGVFKKYPRIRVETEKTQRQLKSLWGKIKGGRSSSNSSSSSLDSPDSSIALKGARGASKKVSKNTPKKAFRQASSRELVKRPSPLTKAKKGSHRGGEGKKTGSFSWIKHQLENPYSQLALAIFGGSLYGGMRVSLYSLSEERVSPMEALKGVHGLLIAELSWQVHDLLKEISAKRHSDASLRKGKMESLRKKLETQKASLKYLQEVAPDFGVSQPLSKEVVELLAQDQEFISACGCSVEYLQISLKTIEEDLQNVETELLTLQNP